jgi:hypothetical protein
MKIIHQSESQLVIEDRPWLLGLLMIVLAIGCLGGSLMFFGQGEMLGGAVMGAVGVGVPLLIGALLVQRVRLTFDRTSGLLTRTRKSVFGLTQKQYGLHRLLRAYTDVSHGDDGPTYRLELQLKEPDETVPFTTYHTSGKKPETLTNAVNDWLGLRL